MISSLKQRHKRIGQEPRGPTSRSAPAATPPNHRATACWFIIAALLAALLAAAPAGAQDPPPPCSGAPHQWHGTPHQSQRTGPRVGSDISKPLTVDEGTSFTIELCAHVQRYIRLAVHDHGAGITFTSTASVRWGSYLVGAQPGDTVTYTVPDGTAGGYAAITFESWGRMIGRTVVPVTITEPQAPPDTRPLGWLEGGALVTDEGGNITVVQRSDRPSDFPFSNLSYKIGGAARWPGEYANTSLNLQVYAAPSDPEWHPDREITVTLLETDEYRVDPARATVRGIVRDTSPRYSLAGGPITLAPGGWASVTLSQNGSPEVGSRVTASITPGHGVGICLTGVYSPTTASCSRLRTTSVTAYGNHDTQNFWLAGSQQIQVYRYDCAAKRGGVDKCTPNEKRLLGPATLTIATPGGNTTVTLTDATPAPPPPPPPPLVPETVPEERVLTPPQAHVDAVRALAAQTRHGKAHTDRWNSLLAAYGLPPVGDYDGPAITPNTACYNQRIFSSPQWATACTVLTEP